MSVYQVFVQFIEILEVLLGNTENNLPIVITFARFIETLKLGNLLI
jgi:hypothetical protein